MTRWTTTNEGHDLVSSTGMVLAELSWNPTCTGWDLRWHDGDKEWFYYAKLARARAEELAELETC